MPVQLIVGSLFAIVTVVYWVLQLATVFFCRRYLVQIAFLLASGVLGLWYVWLVASEEPAGPTAALAVAVGLLSLISLVLGLAKLLVFPGDRIRSMNSLERSLARFSSPVTAFYLQTEDGVRIRTVHLQANPPRRSAVIVCHGGGRSKDVYVYVATCELLFEDYDVLTFDFRGHQESGGKWTGDGSSKYDLKVVIDYARQRGYEKIGVVGRSFGAWTAIIEVAEYQNADTVVAAAPPPTDMREVRMTKTLFRWGFRWWAWPVRVAVTVLRGLRIARYDEHPSLMDFVGQVSPIPLLIVCNEYDRVIGMPAERFEQLYERANQPKKLRVLKGSGHVFDWPNSFTYWTLLRQWLAETLGTTQ
jgi:pimeloyl-ACP methyl ester carboxylesterase